QALGGVPGSQPLLPSGMDPTRQQGHPNMGGPMQRMTPPRGMVPLGPQVPSTDRYHFIHRPVPTLYYPGILGPGGGRPWPNPTNANSVSKYLRGIRHHFICREVFLIRTPGKKQYFIQQVEYCMPCISPHNLHTEWFPMGPGSDGPMSGLGGMDSHHMNGSLG
ncbi:SSBP2 protein, partial [Atlantisia rogersi]|nr:SSBP2 protein [Atlantisia rogersi]